MSPSPPLLLVGCGYTLTRFALREAGARRVEASTRDAQRAGLLEAAGVEVSPDALALAAQARDAHVVYSVPPEANLDAEAAEVLSRARPGRFVYLSSTGVYGAARGEVTEETPVEEGGHGAGRLQAERLFRPLGAVTLRVAGIYGPGRGLQERLRAGSFKLPEGAGRISRVHVDDLVEAISVALARGEPGAVYNVADDEAAPLGEVARWLCAHMNLPPPAAVPLDEAPPTLRGDRAVSNARLRGLGWAPEFPTYREGFAAIDSV